MELTNKFLAKYGLNYDIIVCTNKLKEPILLGTIIDTLLTTKSTTEAQKLLQAKTTFTTDIKNTLDFIQRCGKDWKARVLYDLGLKFCSKCSKIKSLDDFGKRKQGVGINPYCKICAVKSTKAYVENNREKVNSYMLEYSSNIRDKINDKARRRYSTDQTYRQSRLDSMKKYYDSNRETLIAKSAEYRSSLLQRTPGWADYEEILRIYRNCPSGYHVDHIVPLRGELVSGLHVENNLQYLPASENLSKGNKYVL